MVDKKEQIGRKFDTGKPRWGLLPWTEVEEVVDILTFGSEKYEDENWKHVPNRKERYFDALLRHVTQYRMAKESGDVDAKYDDETGKNHLAHAICCALFLMWIDNNPELNED